MSGRVFSGSLDDRFNPFENNLLAEILEAIAGAWARMEPPEGSEIENRITFRLAGRLANDAHFSELPYDVTTQHWLLGLNGERLGCLDLRFKHRYSKRDYLAFESKRLHVTFPGGAFSTEYPTYVGDAGMMTFIEGQYSKGLPAGGMLGYVMDGKTGTAWKGLGNRIDSQQNLLKMVAGSRLTKSILSPAVANGLGSTRLGETAHDLGSHHLRLFHLLLPVTASASA